MTLRLERSEYFWADLEQRVDWHRDHAGPAIAERFVSATQSTLTALCQTSVVQANKPTPVSWESGGAKWPRPGFTSRSPGVPGSNLDLVQAQTVE